ncbi:hypothetical protein ES332_A08G278900v1 [Gossypium tomentosum]|uniref:Secreted protein n=1 Tax=Gossypium tomentosum TaxID=34277 RepID=A0A5D2PLF0_GOSTO|nr:hypothetical protein ES332_A08G278900v1 [Gossypium tomentosum]
MMILSIPFSAFWLRSSVVSVLISLMSDTWANGGGYITVACYWDSRASPKCCTIARAWRTPPNSSFKYFERVCQVQ